MTFWEFSRICTVKRRNLFQDSNFPKSYLLPIRGYSWHKNEIKMIRRGERAFPELMIFWCLLSTLELLTIHLIMKVYRLMTRCLSTPQKWKDRSIEDLDFRLCILGLRTIKRGCSMKSWGEIKSYNHLWYGWENSAEILLSAIFWAETPGLRAGDSDLQRPETLTLDWRLWTKNPASQNRFSPEWCKLLLPLRSLWKGTPETPRFLHQGAGDSGLQSPETPGLVDPNG
jgi:hypothetical protein